MKNLILASTLCFATSAFAKGFEIRTTVSFDDRVAAEPTIFVKPGEKASLTVKEKDGTDLLMTVVAKEDLVATGDMGKAITLDWEIERRGLHHWTRPSLTRMTTFENRSASIEVSDDQNDSSKYKLEVTVIRK